MSTFFVKKEEKRKPHLRAKIARRCSVTIFLTDLDGTVTQHDGKFLAVDGFPFFDGNVLAVDGKSNCDGIFTAVTQHDGKLPAADGFRFFGAASTWHYGKHISST